MNKFLTAILTTAMIASASASVPTSPLNMSINKNERDRNEGKNFDERFENKTLRLDYNFAGNGSTSAIFFEKASMTDGWAGRREHLDKPFLKGQGDIIVTDASSSDTIYTNSFSTLFQEWQVTEEAGKVSKSFQTTYLVPFPKAKVEVEVNLYNNRREKVATLRHPIDPKDILIERQAENPYQRLTIHQGDESIDRVDIVIIGDGYTAEQEDKFFGDARRASEALLSHEPFASMADRFNIVAVAVPSIDEGPDIPGSEIWNNTAFDTHFDTFYSDRYLTTQAIHKIYDALTGVPVEHIILLVNTPKYGGGGIFNQLTLCSSDHPTFKQVLVHEFGHAYAGLGDEYSYADGDDDTYPLDIEPWEPNITTLVDFDSKWADMLPADIEIPTPKSEYPDIHSLDASNPDDAALMERLTSTLGVYEGAGYRSTGIYRPVQECRMKVNEVEQFCPVCTRAIIAITDWYTRP